MNVLCIFTLIAALAQLQCYHFAWHLDGSAILAVFSQSLGTFCGYFPGQMPQMFTFTLINCVATAGLAAAMRPGLSF